MGTIADNKEAFEVALGCVAAGGDLRAALVKFLTFSTYLPVFCRNKTNKEMRRAGAKTIAKTVRRQKGTVLERRQKTFRGTWAV